MDGVAVMRALLLAHAPVTSIVADRVIAGTVPANTELPAIGLSEISRTEMGTVTRAASTDLVNARIQVTVYAGSYPALKAALNAAKLGAGTFTGMIAGVDVCSVLRDSVGPDLSDDVASVYEQSRDFRVSYREPN